MKHTEGPNQTAELLRMAVERMGQQDAGFCPTSYALWYEFAAGGNPELNRVLQERLDAKTRLTDAEVSELHAKYVVKRDVANIERIRTRLLDVLRETSHCISETGTHSVRFQEALETQTARLSQPSALESIRCVVDELLVATQAMCSTSADQSHLLETFALEVRQLEARLQESEARANKDSLTGLLNRGALEDAAQALAQQPGGLGRCAMVIVDVDHFKAINDTYGHLSGDDVLRATAQVIRERTKGSHVCGRLGGDEFALLLPQTPLAGAKVLAEQIRTTVRNSKLRRAARLEEVYPVTLSLGVAEGVQGDSFDSLLRRADAALYRAKNAGRNHVVTDREIDTELAGPETDPA